MSIFDKIFGHKEEAKRGSDEYLKQKDIAATGSSRKRMSLAKNSSTNREILYFLAEKDPEPSIRRAVIENKSMPIQLSPILATDEDKDVRLALARRLIGLLPDLSEDKQSQLYAFAVQALGTLALDEVLKIRKALSSTLKDHAHTPPKIAGQLARDIEREVSEPILKFCAALSDEDLLDILKSHPDSWAIEAIAGREYVSEDISGAVINTEDKPGGKALLENEGANITESLLHIIVEKARFCPEWQKPMALRKTLPEDIAKDLAEFVDASVRDLLLNRDDFDGEMMEDIAKIFRRRVDFISENEDETLSATERLSAMVKEGTLNEETISDAMAMRDEEFVCTALAYLGKTDFETIRKIFDVSAPKPIVALCWHAGLSMRMALQLQKDIGQVQPRDLLYPKDGEDYPLTEDELNWQLEFLGLKAA